MPSDTPRFQQWLAAERAAQAAERELYAAMVEFAKNTSGSPAGGQVEATRALRREAHRLFQDAMQELKEVAESLHYRRILATDGTELRGTPGRRSGNGSSGNGQASA